MESIISPRPNTSSSGTGPGITKGRPQSRRMDPAILGIDKEKYSISISFGAIERNPSKKRMRENTDSCTQNKSKDEKQI